MKPKDPRASRDHHKDSSGPKLPQEFPCFGPDPRAVRAVTAGLLRALPTDLRVGCVTDPSGGEAFPAMPGRIILSAPEWNADSWRAAMSDCDLVLTEGRPKPGFPGILVLPASAAPQGASSAGQSNSDVTSGGDPLETRAAVLGNLNVTHSLLACVSSHQNPLRGRLPEGVPVFSPDSLEALASAILAHARTEAAKVPLYGLVLAGGRSTRMRADKASLAYHGKPQTEHCLELLAPHCARAFLSCRPDQAGLPGFAGHAQVHDAFFDMGPSGGILSALKAHREAAFLVVACDLPFLDAAALKALVAARDPLKAATAFAGPDGLPEPLCAVYEPRAYARMLQLAGQGLHCPRKFLLNSSTRIIPAPDPRFLTNANDPEAYRAAVAALTAP